MLFPTDIFLVNPSICAWRKPEDIPRKKKTWDPENKKLSSGGKPEQSPGWRWREIQIQWLWNRLREQEIQTELRHWKSLERYYKGKDEAFRILWKHWETRIPLIEILGMDTDHIIGQRRGTVTNSTIIRTWKCGWIWDGHSTVNTE